MNKIVMFIIGFAIALLIGGIYLNMVDNKGSGNPRVKLETNRGDIIIELYSNEMPITAGNFEKLVSEGFYDGVIFHRVIDGFMLQGGDPDGTGMGGPGYSIEDEFTNTDLDKNNRGTISMANAGPNTNGSQFFITTKPTSWLNMRHTIFGEVASGYSVVQKIENIAVGAQDRPIDEQRIIKAYLK